MKVNSVITIEGDINCLLLEETDYENAKYFLATILDDNEEPSDESVIFKEVVENDEVYVEQVNDPELIAKLSEKFTESLDKLITELPDSI